MEVRIINRARGLGVGRLSARYRRLRFAESQAMSHCVRLYDLACWRGLSAIFSVLRGERRCVTVEINLATRQVVQAKRVCNQVPSTIELAVSEHWRASVIDPS